MEGVKFIRREFVGFCGVKGGVWIGRFDVKYTGFDVVNLCKHSEGSSIHKVD